MASKRTAVRGSKAVKVSKPKRTVTKTKTKRKPANSEVYAEDKGSDGRFVEGHPGRNTGQGRPKGVRNRYTITEFETALREVEREKKKPLLKHFIERAYDDDGVLIALMKKRLPDLKAIETLIGTTQLDDEQAEAIRQKLVERFQRGNYGGSNVVLVDGRIARLPAKLVHSQETDVTVQ